MAGKPKRTSPEYRVLGSALSRSCLAATLALLAAGSCHAALGQAAPGPESAAERRPADAPPQPKLPGENEPRARRSGKWIERNGSRICDGYLTRRKDQDFCAAEVPEDWVPFEFAGKTYYVQPLSQAPLR